MPIKSAIRRLTTGVCFEPTLFLTPNKTEKQSVDFIIFHLLSIKHQTIALLYRCKQAHFIIVLLLRFNFSSVVAGDEKNTIVVV